MVSYRITVPRKNGDYHVVDVKEYHGGSIVRSSTIRVDQLVSFLKAVFHGELHKEYKDILEQLEDGFARCKTCGYLAKDKDDADRHFEECEDKEGK